MKGLVQGLMRGVVFLLMSNRDLRQRRDAVIISRHLLN